MELGQKDLFEIITEQVKITEYTRFGNILRFPRVAGEPPRATHSGVSPMPFLPQESSYISEANLAIVRLLD
jgi:hypothetical protein